MINETLSFDSTLESPTKPHQEKNSAQNKAIFLVHYMNENQSFNPINENIDENQRELKSAKYKIRKKSKRGPKPKKFEKNFKSENNMLDFDGLLDALFPKPKIEIVSPLKKKISTGKKYQKKMAGFKRKRSIKECLNKSRFKFFIEFHFYRN